VGKRYRDRSPKMIYSWQKAHEKIINITDLREMQIKTTRRLTLHTYQNVYNHRHWREYGRTGNLIPYWWQGKNSTTTLENGL